MLIKIGDAFVDPLEIAAIQPAVTGALAYDHNKCLCIQLRRGSTVVVQTTMDEAEAALIDAGVIEDPEEDCGPMLTDAEVAKLNDLLDRDFGWLARDADGLYAFVRMPKRDGDGYWSYPDGDPEPEAVDTEGFEFVDVDDDEPWSIPLLLLE